MIHVGTMQFSQLRQESSSRRSRPEVPLSEEQRPRGSDRRRFSGRGRQKMGKYAVAKRMLLGCIIWGI